MKLVGDGEGAVAADADERVELRAVEHLDHARGVVERPLRCRNRLEKRVSAVHGPEDRAAQPQDAGDIAGRQRSRLLGIDQAVEAVFEADDLEPGVAARLDDSTDDGVQARSVAAAGEHADFLECGHS